MADLKAKGSCDFCGEACNADMRGAKAYDCADFEMPMGGTSAGAWAACPACATTIDDERWDALDERMTELCRHRWGAIAELNLPTMHELDVEIIRLFRQHRLVNAVNGARLGIEASKTGGLRGIFRQGGGN